MSSHCALSDALSDPALRTCTLPTIPSSWSDFDSLFSSSSDSESPWWESADEKETQLVCSISSESPDADLSPPNCGNVTNTSSGTPPWWSTPSSELSTSVPDGDGIEAKPCRENESGKELENHDKDKQCSSSSRKRSRQQSLHETALNEPPASKQKREPPSPHSNPHSVLQNLKNGIVQPLKAFCVFFTVDLLTRICDLTNQRGWQRVLEDPSIAGDDGSWKEVTVKEMYAFMAIILIMRRHQDVCFGDFWREQSNTSDPWPRMLMNRRRFFTLLWMLKCNNKLDQTKPNHRYGVEITKDDSVTEEFKHFFDQAKLVYKVFFTEFELQYLEEIFLRDGPGNARDFKHFMKVTKSDDGVNANHILRLGQKNEIKPVDGRRSPNTENIDQSESHSDPLSKSSSMKPTSPPKEQNGTSDQQFHRSTVLDMTWRDGSLMVATKHYSKPRAKHSFSLMEKTDDTSSWQEVFIPCPELVYKEYTSGNALSLDSEMMKQYSRQPMSQSFFYYYLNLAVYFSTSNDIMSRFHAESTGIQSQEDYMDCIVEELAILGKPDSLVPFDSDDDTSESEEFGDSTSTDPSDVDDNDSNDEAVGRKPHKYVQARSQRSRQCVLCWSLHQEVRRVHTRCTRCERHFCLSRFRNCMKEAHDDKEVIKQLRDEETSDIQDTSDAFEMPISYIQ